jgi:hypothetical protein
MVGGREDTVAIGVMAKAPEPGRSKTRLCPPLLPEQAAALSAAFLRDTTQSMAAAARLAPIVAYAAYARRWDRRCCLGSTLPPARPCSSLTAARGCRRGFKGLGDVFCMPFRA